MLQGVFYRRNGSIYFNSVDESHAGRYSCTPYNTLGTEGASPLIRVFVQRPPVFTLKPKPIYVHKLGDTATFQCDATDQDGQHRTIIQWRRKDGTPLPFSRVTLEGINFSIESVNETDRGIYECIAVCNLPSLLKMTYDIFTSGNIFVFMKFNVKLSLVIHLILFIHFDFRCFVV